MTAGAGSIAGIYRGAAAILWVLAIWHSLAYRGLFWDGSAFLVEIIDNNWFHWMFYPARAHVMWLTQLPVVVALKLGVTDTRILAIAYSAGLFAVPTALYHLALWRARGDAVALAVVLAAVAVVYLSTSFFIAGEYNTAFAIAVAVMTIVVTGKGLSRSDIFLLVFFGWLAFRSYEAMAYFGPLLAAAIAWRLRTTAPPGAVAPRYLLGYFAALLFIGASAVSFVTMAQYWQHAYFMRVRVAAFDFWQNLQFVLAAGPLILFAVAALLRPAWLRSAPLFGLLWLGAVLLIVSPWLRFLNETTLLYPPAHHIARTAAGALLWTMLAGLWLFAMWTRNPPRLFAVIRQPAVGRRLVASLFVLIIGATIPDIALTRLWTQYIDAFRGLTVGHPGVIDPRAARLYEWPDKLFRQDWTYAPLSLVLRSNPSDGLVLPRQDYTEPRPFDPACGLPDLKGYDWRS
jgi:hypothetical protein